MSLTESDEFFKFKPVVEAQRTKKPVKPSTGERGIEIKEVDS